jgi:hypothetical protein
MNLDVITIILFAAAATLGIAYFVRRSARLKKQRRQL